MFHRNVVSQASTSNYQVEENVESVSQTNKGKTLLKRSSQNEVVVPDTSPSIEYEEKSLDVGKQQQNIGRPQAKKHCPIAIDSQSLCRDQRYEYLRIEILKQKIIYIFLNFRIDDEPEETQLDIPTGNLSIDRTAVPIF